MKPATFGFEAFGVRIGITVDAADLVGRVMEVLPPGWAPICSSDCHRRYHIGRAGQVAEAETITINGEPPEPFRNRRKLLDFLEGDIQLHIAEFAFPHLFVHAGVVGWHGRAILLPGRSFAGKSTLVTSLVNAGATYYSDEYAVLDDEGRVLPYPRRVSLREGPHGPAHRLGLWNQATHMAEPLPVGMVALLRYDAGVTWHVHTLSKAEAIMSLCDQTVAIRDRARDVLSVLGKVVDDATLIQGLRGEVDEAVEALVSMVELWDLKAPSTSQMAE